MILAPARDRVDELSPGSGADARARAAARRRVAHLAAGGRTAAQIAAIEGADEAQIETLLGDEAIGRMVRAYEVLEAEPPEERRAELVRIARFLIDEAIGLGHVRVAFFVVREELHGRDAAETVADKLIAQRAKAAEPPPTPKATRPAAKSHLPAHPADRMAQRACRDLMRALLAEFRLRAEAAARAAKRAPAALAAAVRLGLPPHVAGRLRRLAARLLTTAAAIPPLGHPPKLAQAP